MMNEIKISGKRKDPNETYKGPKIQSEKSILIEYNLNICI